MSFIRIFLIALFIMSFSVISFAESKSYPPFLILGKMPHLTKDLIQKWKDEELALTADQQKALKVIRVETLSKAQVLKKAINELENEIAKRAMNGEKPENLYEKVEQVAALKVEATKLQLDCIYDTMEILSKAQLEYVLK